MADMIKAYEVFMNRFRMQSDDAQGTKPAKVVLSTVELPDLIEFENTQRYETCVFRGNSTQILRRYHSQGEAVEGHRIMEARMGLRSVSKLARA